MPSKPQWFIRIIRSRARCHRTAPVVCNAKLGGGYRCDRRRKPVPPVAWAPAARVPTPAACAGQEARQAAKAVAMATETRWVTFPLTLLPLFWDTCRLRAVPYLRGRSDIRFDRIRRDHVEAANQNATGRASPSVVTHRPLPRVTGQRLGWTPQHQPKNANRIYFVTRYGSGPFRDWMIGVRVYPVSPQPVSLVEVGLNLAPGSGAVSCRRLHAHGYDTW